MHLEQVSISLPLDRSLSSWNSSKRRIQGENKQTAKSAGKPGRPSRDWCKLWTWLVERVVRVLWTDHGQIPDYFRNSIEIFLCIRQSGRFVFCKWAWCLIENIIWPGVQRGVGSKSLPSGTTRSRVSYIATTRRKTTFGRPCLKSTCVAKFQLFTSLLIKQRFIHLRSWLYAIS